METQVVVNKLYPEEFRRKADSLKGVSSRYLRKNYSDLSEFFWGNALYILYLKEEVLRRNLDKTLKTHRPPILRYMSILRTSSLRGPFSRKPY